jgi:hypothetical protein
MRRNRIRHLFVAMAMAVSMSPTAWACPCELPTAAPIEQQVRAAMANASAVFEGVVTSIRAGDDGGPALVTLTVRRVWKGAVAQTTVLEQESSDCVYSFREGDAYLIYAVTRGEALTAGRCQRTRPRTAADADVRVLGHGHRPAP